MKLYLSSFPIGSGSAWLRENAGSRGEVGVILYAIDDRTPEARKASWRRESSALQNLGFQTIELDLRVDRCTHIMRSIGTVWVRGGNTFLLRQRIAQSGIEDLLVRRVADGDLMYAGYSAGATVLTRDITYLASIDDPHVAGSPPPERGLGLLDRPLIPHVDSPGHPESGACTQVSRDLRSRNIEHWALSDGQVLIQQGPVISLLSPPREEG
ncbi:dipeptidase E [Arthrobacter sp. GAS37]|uniref:Type 1 glutamine amidotransferase-like domain-containing protein n=1 Tax=Arthrobacter sp. GAS37 TaxID=3156261 RepID=UPI003836E248